MPESYAFAGFLLEPDRRKLFNGGAPVRLGDRAFDILCLLVARAGATVGVRDIVETVWDDRTADGAAIRVHLAALRKVLGDSAQTPRFIANDAGRGYRFIMPVERTGTGVSLPTPLTALIGRDEALSALTAQIRANRMVTIVGPGGIGKTRLALAVAQRLSADVAHGARFVDLASVSAPSHVATRIASELDLFPQAQPDAIAAICAHLRDRELLLILDNCEHVIDAAAEVAERLLRACGRLRLVATSREALRIEGEMLHHAMPLAAPPTGSVLSAEQARAYPAIQLFLERCGALGAAADLTDETSERIAELCRKLDGLPLAIELAAAGTPAFGIDGLLATLDESLVMLSQGRRTELRHQTLRATLDWSFDRLPPPDRATLVRLSIFRGWISPEAAAAVAGDGDANRLAISLATLVAKSLVLADASDGPVRYRLLDTTRTHAFERLKADGDVRETIRRHIDFQKLSLRQAALEWETRPKADWWRHYSGFLRDIETALDHAFGDADGDLRSGLSLTVASAPLWLGLSRLRDFDRMLLRALDRLETLRAADPVTADALRDEEVQLRLLQAAAIFTREGPNEAEWSALERARRLAQETGDGASTVTALWGLASVAMVRGDYPGAARLADELDSFVAANGDARSAPVVDRIRSLTLFRLGRHAAARTLCERAAGIGVAAVGSFQTAYRWHHTTTARANLSHILYLQGERAAARRMSDGAAEDAQAARNPASFCYILAFASCPLRLWMDDETGAVAHLGLLRQTAEENGFGYFLDWASFYDGVLDVRRTAETPASLRLRQRFPTLRAQERELLFSAAPDLLDADLVQRIERDPDIWIAPEVLRHRAAALLRDGHAAEAGALLVRARDLATRQGATLFALRAASDLVARSWPGRSAGQDRRDLARLADAVPERSDCPDLARARGLFQACSVGGGS